jgi:proline dehydrogenase
VRLVKGAYNESPEIAFPRKADVDRAYRVELEMLLARAHYPALATHDEELIGRAQGFAAAEGIAESRFEFQMLYGVRRDLQERLAREGYNVRCYVPYGTQWYPYFMRRLAERPANVLFILGNLVRK